MQCTASSSSSMEESPPPVPPKDTPKQSKMPPTSAPASGSKRKREAAQDDPIYDFVSGGLVAVDDANEREHSPKRSRQSDSEDTSTTSKPGLRRKKKVNNLSNLNLRHAARKQQQQQQQQQAAQQARESKFQEGSLTDKPSQKPPSAFTRMIRTDSGDIKQVDELMEGYDNGEAVQAPVAPAATPATTSSSGGIFTFGRTFGNFHPIALWNKMWNETKEELYRRNVEEAERKRREQQRLEAEAQYAKLKAAGQLGLTPVNIVAERARRSGDASTMRDSAVVVPSTRPSAEHKSTASDVPTLVVHPTDEVESGSGSEVPDTASKGGTLRSRLSFFTKPSISNLKGSVLKRVKSDYNLASAANRESSSSLSPVKQDFDQSTLRRSASKYDMKKQQRLSKRVSDLEAKLNVARRELDNALVEASPAPKLNDRYARFTPQSTFKRQKFVPGRLAALPSERLLMAERMSFGGDEATPMSKSLLGRGGDPSELMDLDDGDETIKATRARPYPTRAVDLFKLDDDDNIGSPPVTTENNINGNHKDQEPTSSPTQLISDDMDPNTALSNNPAPTIEPAGDYASLDAKLKALDKNVKASKKPGPGKGKKRKSSGDDGDKLFRPGKETTDDEEEMTPRKKRKSAAKGEASSPQQGGKRGRREKKKTGGNAEVRVEKVTVQEEVEVFSEVEEVDKKVSAGAEDEHPAARPSLDSQGVPLEPVYEEEEEVSIVPINDEPSKPTALATPARFASRSRSRSPVKTKAGAEEVMMTRAAEAVKGRRGDGAEGMENGREEGFEWPDDVF